MTGSEIIEVGREAITVFLLISSPILLIGLAVGVVIAFFQSITQINEMTLTFVPKILAVFGGMIFFFPYMGRLMSSFMESVMSKVIAGG